MRKSPSLRLLTFPPKPAAPVTRLLPVREKLVLFATDVLTLAEADEPRAQAVMDQCHSVLRASADGKGGA